MNVRPEDLTGAEQAVLLVLMAEVRPVPNPELAQLGPELTKPSREKLNRLGLIESTQEGRRFVHELTDRGWATCRSLLGAAVPPGAKGQAKAFYTVLRGLGTYLEREDVPLAEVFRTSRPVARSGATVAVGAAGAAPTGESAETLIRSSYGRLAGAPGGWVGLARLRAAVGGVARTDLDAELRRMYRIPGVHLIPEENQKVLTAEDRAAAVEIGGQAKHVIAIEA
ncbi:hypothetical protein [Mycolicibacterium palauense]|uniref:hypothetical protein n=1 Tax=Mycolicibacterium palauense TaxID=2034511 RepID=UPI000BFEB765|nr:hypothetical protein [Mycolicibacterium palauense]